MWYSQGMLLLILVYSSLLQSSDLSSLIYTMLWKEGRQCGTVLLILVYSSILQHNSVVDPHHVDADPDPDYELYLMRIRILMFIRCGSGSDFSP